MKRKSIVTGSLVLSLLNAILLVASIALVLAGALYFFIGESFQLVKDLFGSVLSFLLAYGNIVMLVIVVVLFILSILALIASTRLIKYSGASVEQFARKKGVIVTSVLCLVLVFAVFAGYMIYKAVAGEIFLNMILDIVILSIAGIYLLCLVPICVGVAKAKKPQATYASQTTGETPAISPAMQEQAEERVAIYTNDLEGEPEEHITVVQEQKEEQPVEKQKPYESDSTKNLIAEIGKLDEMRKNGEITQEEYTKRRMALITGFVK
ncbi:MAG: SHOCT domain-containing protein [Clostridia bacterium]|nr:SHOCT domain-containing protein [Clostridia bacterium]